MLSERCVNLLTVAIAQAKLWGVEIADVVSNRTIALWTFGMQNVLFRRMFSVDRKMTLNVRRTNVSRIGAKGYTSTVLNGMSYTTENIDVFTNALRLEKIIVLGDTS